MTSGERNERLDVVPRKIYRSEISHGEDKGREGGEGSFLGVWKTRARERE